MPYEEISALLSPLYADAIAKPPFWERKPLLAHYTSISTLASIVQNKEVWFSNPLLMNDHEELRFGIGNAMRAIRTSNEINLALETDERRAKFRSHVDFFVDDFDERHLLDVYVFCLSEHEATDTDGLLSMWRGYGSDGNGAAVVFDTSKLSAPHEGPLILDSVHYANHEERLKWIEELVSKFAALLASQHVADDDLYNTAHILMNRILLFSLFTKHDGFREEREWRAVYLPTNDMKKIFSPFFGYHVLGNKVEPKLKFPIRPIPSITSDDATLEKIIHSIILGPNASVPMTRRSIERMLELLGAPELRSRVVASTIPYRATTR
jgi:Protein of unknown function (DUF2971)